MRFTSLSTLTNTLFISTVILLSLIPAANAYAVVVFTNPTNGTVYHAGDTIPVKWYVPKGGKLAGTPGRHDRSLTAGIAGTPITTRIYLE
jgi:hypothetical protein